MMGIYTEEIGDQFFDSREELSDLGSDCSDGCSSSSGLSNYAPSSFQYEFWIKTLDGVNERRGKFLRWMGLGSDQNSIMEENTGDMSCENFEEQASRITEVSGTVLRTLGLEDDFSACESFASFRSCRAPEFLEGGELEEIFASRFENLDNGIEFVVAELDDNGILGRSSEVGSNQSVAVGEFQRTEGSSSLVQKFSLREEKGSNIMGMKKKSKHRWLRRLGSLACIVNGQGEANLNANDLDPIVGIRNQRVRVHPRRKKSKELSSVYMGQEFLAHKGSILTMKFSLDGQYLASGGEDGIVCIWKVIEDETPNKIDISDMDPSCFYFTMNQLSKLSSVNVDKDKLGKMKRMRKLSDSACVIFPPKIFHLMETPLHRFHGHNGEVLDLSWSHKGYLLSSSVDKTVRLWQVGCDQCLRVFAHNNYVPSVEFNPVDDNYFISGSIDGKVRIWEVLGCQVVDWTDVREIVTAVCYRPDGKGGIVGSMTGNCRFYDIIDNQLQLDTQICVQGKKNLPSKRITGFQFSPDDSSRLMVTSADTHVRILSGADVVCKFRGLRSGGNQISASFTADGKHVVSAGEDSNVYIWNYMSQDKTSSRAKNVLSCESFSSHNASIAIPWYGKKSVPGTPFSLTFGSDLPDCGVENRLRRQLDENSRHKKPSSSPDCFSLSRGFSLEPLPKGTATWPEEKLSSPSPVGALPTICKSEYKFLKSAYHSTFNTPHMWGLVIVTAGWDGRIRTYLNYGLPLHL